MAQTQICHAPTRGAGGCGTHDVRQHLIRLLHHRPLQEYRRFLLYLQGQQIQLHLADANRDGSVFPAPETFRLQRSNTNRHLAFGFRDHLCPVMTCGNVGAGGGKVTVWRGSPQHVCRSREECKSRCHLWPQAFEQRAVSRSLTS